VRKEPEPQALKRQGFDARALPRVNSCPSPGPAEGETPSGQPAGRRRYGRFSHTSNSLPSPFAYPFTRFFWSAPSVFADHDCGGLGFLLDGRDARRSTPRSWAGIQAEISTCFLRFSTLPQGLCSAPNRGFRKSFRRSRFFRSSACTPHAQVWRIPLTNISGRLEYATFFTC